jgi:hypothetical protein
MDREWDDNIERDICLYCSPVAERITVLFWSAENAKADFGLWPVLFRVKPDCF